MKTTYIQFHAPKNDIRTAKDGLIKSSLKKVLLGILTKIIPKGNPDFDDKIKEVQYWLVECDNETGTPEREIGLNKEGRVIMKMPYSAFTRIPHRTSYLFILIRLRNIRSYR